MRKANAKRRSYERVREHQECNFRPQRVGRFHTCPGGNRSAAAVPKSCDSFCSAGSSTIRTAFSATASRRGSNPEWTCCEESTEAELAAVNSRPDEVARTRL